MNDTLMVLIDSSLLSFTQKDAGVWEQATEFLDVVQKILMIFGTLCVGAFAVIALCWSIIKDRIKEAFDSDVSERKEIHKICHLQQKELISVMHQAGPFCSAHEVDKMYSMALALDEICYFARTDIANQSLMLRLLFDRYSMLIDRNARLTKRTQLLFIDTLRKIELDCVKTVSIPKIWKIISYALMPFLEKNQTKTPASERSPLRKYDIAEDVALPKGVDFRVYDSSVIEFQKRILNTDDHILSLSFFRVMNNSNILLYLLNEKSIVVPLKMTIPFPELFDIELSLFAFRTTDFIGEVNGKFVEAFYCATNVVPGFDASSLKRLSTNPAICKKLGNFYQFGEISYENNCGQSFIKIKVHIDAASSLYTKKKILIDRLLEVQETFAVDG